MPKAALNGPSGAPARLALATSVTPLATPLLQLPLALPSDSRPLVVLKTVLPSRPSRFQPAAEAGSNLAKAPV